MFAVDPEEYYYTGEGDPSPYELAMEQSAWTVCSSSK